MNFYEQKGYQSRTHYLEELAEEFEVPLWVVEELAETLGPNEDFDGLVIALEEYQYEHE